MATTHVFIVDSNTFKYHLEYMFAGTGAGDKFIDFNNHPTTMLHSKTESGLVGMIADAQRIRKDDSVIFYLQQNSSMGITEGQFFGVFRVQELVFLDNNDNNQFLKHQLNKSLTFRILIQPDIVYAQGISEWEALDEIQHIQSPYEMQWSLIYRKLTGNRGNTMITLAESESLKTLIQNKNHSNSLGATNYTFDIHTQTIQASQSSNKYNGRQTPINIFPRLLDKYCNGLQFETHLQAYILQNLSNINIFKNENIEWIGNEVSCGVGMQSIDIMLSSIRSNNKICMPIELKSTIAFPKITIQVQRYVDWIKQYYIQTNPSLIEPMVISREILNKQSQSYIDLIQSFNVFNQQNGPIRLRYVEFSISCKNPTLNFTEINY